MEYTNEEIIDNLKATLAMHKRSGPWHFNMASWISVNSEDEDEDDDDFFAEDLGEITIEIAKKLPVSCGTTACLAGTAVAAAMWEKRPIDFKGYLDDADATADWLGICGNLFMPNLWATEIVYNAVLGDPKDEADRMFLHERFLHHREQWMNDEATGQAPSWVHNPTQQWAEWNAVGELLVREITRRGATVNFDVDLETGQAIRADYITISSG